MINVINETTPADISATPKADATNNAAKADTSADAKMSPPAVAKTSSRPKDIPEKFWDAEKQTIDTDRLWQSYQELERRFGSRHTGVPGSHEDYCLDCGDRAPDPEVNAVLHRAGFTNEQAQVVYDLAAHYVVPELEARDKQIGAERVKGRLEEHFGGEERWANVARQLGAWGEAHLPKDVMAAMSGSFEGVLALHRLMASDEPGIDVRTGTAATSLDENALRKLMQDPKYWRDQDPGLIARIRDGFSRLYPS